MWENREVPLSDEITSGPPDDTWLSDRIASVTEGPDTSLLRDGSGLRLRPQGQFLRMQFVNVYVRDQERTLRFFVDQLGFELVLDVRFASGNRFVQVSPPDGTCSLTLMLPRPGTDEEYLVGRSGSVSFLTEDVTAAYSLWSARGVRFSISPQTPSWGGIFCRFEDPDGNPFMLIGFDEMNREIEARRRALLEKIEAERRAAQELEIATQVQARLFPQRLPPVPGLDYAGVCRQARSVGGDYYDFLDLGTERIALVVGDISGKGIAAALLMANLQANLRSQCVNAVEHPDKVLNLLNRLLYENTDANAYATLFFAEFDHRSGRVRYANCGHLAALVLRHDDAIEHLDPTCTVIGMFEDWQCAMGESRLDPGDVLALYTDGLTESFNTAEEEFGEERLAAALRRHRHLPANEFVAAVIEEARRFSTCEQFDDITLIIARRL
jgi:serine phosphatase RsbU (regulator of sigma subunit)/catechol 2,3-dioxygenase-like lactoylglutathione lyase family enzyme